jgi:hypothetical protein
MKNWKGKRDGKKIAGNLNSVSCDRPSVYTLSLRPQYVILVRYIFPQYHYIWILDRLKIQKGMKQYQCT